jgi:amino acid adenylation domain-containing protein
MKMSTTIQNLLLNPFQKSSKNIAIDIGNRKISYEQLKCKANMIANLILQNSCEKQEIIAIYMEDKVNIISTILAILEMGCVFAAIDPSYPNNRIQQQLSVITPPLVLTDSELLNNKILNDFQYLAKNINEAKSTASILPEIEYLEDDKVYIYFTSGTTGIPNAITGKNKSLAHFIEWESNELAVQPTVRVSQLTPPGHDPFLRDIFLALTNGGCICIPPNKNNILEPSLLCEWIDQLNIEIIHCTPSLFSVMNRKMLSDNDFKNLKYVLLAGEKIIPSQLTYWYETFSNRIQLYNLYGPTETTMAKLFYPIQPQDAWRSSIPIGKPIKATRVLIMNNKKICDVGEIGEIYIRTPYMTYGYFNNEHLQNERFIQNPFKKEKDIIFKTGDLGRLLSDGNIDFVGRVDRQIKIRGQRVELSEIENDFLQIKGTINCAAVYHEKESHDREQCCIYCGLTSNYPGVSFNEKGICNFCETFPALKKMNDSYFKKIFGISS